MTFGEKIKKIRKEMNLPQSEFAKLCEIAEASLSRYERDEHFPRLDTVFHIANMINMTVVELLEDVSYPLI